MMLLTFLLFNFPRQTLIRFHQKRCLSSKILVFWYFSQTSDILSCRAVLHVYVTYVPVVKNKQIFNVKRCRIPLKIQQKKRGKLSPEKKSCLYARTTDLLIILLFRGKFRRFVRMHTKGNCEYVYIFYDKWNLLGRKNV